MIRQYEERDLTQVAKIWLDSHIRSHKFIPTDLWHAGGGIIKQIIAENNLYVSVERGEINGFLIMSGEDILGVYAVFGKYFRKTVSALLSHAQSLCPHLLLHAYTIDNEALRVYRHANFSVIGESVSIYTNEPELLLEWSR